MALEALKQAEKHTVGVKQTEKAVARQVAAVVYIASDADERVTGRLMQLCRENAVPVENTETMLEIGRACGINVKALLAHCKTSYFREIGRACGINVKAAAAAILKADKGLA